MATNEQQPDSQQPTHIGGFEILEQIGEGGMGVVYRAKQTSLDRIVALKVLTPRLAAVTSYIERFIREAKAAARLKHPNVVGVHDAGERDGVYYYAMEFVSGETLSSWVKREGALPEKTVLGIGLCVASALKHAWDKEQLIHRDIKPENVMVDTEGDVKLCDLGLAKFLGESSTSTLSGNIVGTPQYMSPEQAQGDQTVDFRSDIYSLGMTLYFAVTGTIPFHAASATLVMARHLTEQLPDPRTVVEGVSEDFCRVLEKMLAKDLNDRYQSWDDVLRDIETVLREVPMPQPIALTGRSSLRLEIFAVPHSQYVAPVPHAVQAPPQRVAIPIPPPIPVPKKSKLPLVLVAVGAAILLLVVGGAFAVMFALRKPQPTVAANGTPNVAAKQPADVPPTRPQDPEAQTASASIPLKTLEAIKDATVFIKIEVGRLGSSGSGFVIQADGNTRYLVTNEHVVSVSELRLLGKPIVTAIFRSGTKQEQAVKAEIIATDEERDLAILKVTGVGLPEPIDLNNKPKLVETMQIYTFGFPFGDKLSASHGNPAITVGRGAVSSIRLDDDGNLAVVQIDGALNPGNSGGPVVDSQGRLVGVAVATIKGAGIGLAIPMSELDKMLGGEVESMELTVRQVINGVADVGVKAKLIDPFNKMKSVSVVYSETVDESFKPNKDGTWARVPNSQNADLQMQQQSATGLMQVTSANKSTVKIWVQPSFISGDGKTVFMEPVPYLLKFGAGAPTVARAPSLAEEELQRKVSAAIAEELKRMTERRAASEKLLQESRRVASQVVAEQRAIVAAEQAFAEFSEKFKASLAKRNYADAVKLAQDATADLKLAPLKHHVAEASDAAKRLKDFWQSLAANLIKLKGQELSLQKAKGVLTETNGDIFTLELRQGVAIDLALGDLSAEEILVLATMIRPPPDAQASLDLAWFFFAEGKPAEADKFVAPKEVPPDARATARRSMEALTKGVAEEGAAKHLAHLRTLASAKNWDSVQATIGVLRNRYANTKTVAEAAPIFTEYQASIEMHEAFSKARVGELVRTFAGHSAQVSSVAFSKDGLYLLSGSFDKTVSMWSLATGKEVRPFHGHTSGVQVAAFTADGRQVVAGSHGKSVRVWDVNSGENTAYGQEPKTGGATWVGGGGVFIVAVSPDGRFALSSNIDPMIRNTVAREEAGRIITTETIGGYLKLWEVASGREVRLFRGFISIVQGIVFSPDGRLALSGGDDTFVTLWDVNTGRSVRQYRGHTSTVTGVAFSPDGQSALSASWDGTARLWDLKTGRSGALRGHTDKVLSVAISPDGRYGLTGSTDGTMRLWNLMTGKELRSMRHNGAVMSVAFSPDGAYALSGCADKTMNLWKIAEDSR